MDRDNESIYLLDMTRCQPADAIGTDFVRGRWTAVDFSIAAGAGKMLFSGPDTQAPPVQLDPEVSGWYHIFVGTYRYFMQPDYCLLLKLSSDRGYSRAEVETFRRDKDLVAEEMILGQTDLAEAYWKSADLSGEEIIFHRPTVGQQAEKTTNISYIRLVPLSAAEQVQAEADRQPGDHRRLLANYDGGQNTLWAHASDDEMRDEFQALAQTDVRSVLWGCARSFATYYPSKVASNVKWSYGLPGIMRQARLAIERQRQHDFDSLRSAVKCAREIGIDIYPQMRMSGEQLPPNHLDYSGPGEFQQQHPEFRCLSPEGYRTRHLSQAFGEVRAKYIDLFREWVEDYEADGVCIVFCRSWPYVLFEQPVLDSFKAVHGIGMQDIDYLDERVLRHRASFLTQLLRETRQMLDQVGEKSGRSLRAVYVIPAEDYSLTPNPDLGPFSHLLMHAMDVETWVGEGLVDDLVVHIQDTGDPAGNAARQTLATYVELAQGTTTQIHADLYPRRQSADSMRVRAMACYEAGVDGLSFWDSHGRAMRLSGWAMHRLQGHRDELAGMKPFADSLFRRKPLTTLDGYEIQSDFCLPSDG
jgi:uncharacterized lipoprotein YddW (UPF0748 family)